MAPRGSAQSETRLSQLSTMVLCLADDDASDEQGGAVGRGRDEVAHPHGLGAGASADGTRTGTVCFGFKGGIGTSSRRASGYTVGAPVQTNYGGQLRIVPVGKLPKQNTDAPSGGSVVVIVATDAPLDHRNFRHLGECAKAAQSRRCRLSGRWTSCAARHCFQLDRRAATPKDGSL